MKTKNTLFAICAGMLCLADGSEETLLNRSIEMRPTEKRALTLKSSERNPYANRTPQTTYSEEEESSEETAIRARLDSIEVTGASRGPNGMILLLGDILIEKGKVLPQLVQNQTHDLKVIEIAEERIVLGWMDVETGELTGKTMQLLYDLRPTVNYVLQGQGATPKAKKVMGVLKRGSSKGGATERFAQGGR